MPTRALERWLPPRALADLEDAGIVERSGPDTRPRVRLDVVQGLLVASDLSRLHGARDFVVGAGPSSLLLARYVPARAGGRLLDLGCGSGIQGLLSGDARTHVTAVDINPRALAFTRFNARLNGRPRLHAEAGDFLSDDPDRRLDGRFDTVIANPPFVMSPVAEMIYRDRSLPGDAVGERTVARVATALAPGGRGYVLCNWIDRGSAWSDPVRRWTASLDREVTVTRIRTLEPPEYAAIWTRTLRAEARPAATRAWAATLQAEGVSRIHVGIIAVTRTTATRRRANFEAQDERPTIGRAAMAAAVATGAPGSAR